MADKIRTRAEMLRLLADNTAGAISPQDLRDMFVTLWSRAAVTPTIKIGAYTVDPLVDELIIATNLTTLSSFDLTLPLLSDVNLLDGQIFQFKRKDSAVPAQGGINIRAAGTDNIDGTGAPGFVSLFAPPFKPAVLLVADKTRMTWWNLGPLGVI